MSENDRQQRLIERVQEDERLRGDLTDEAAAALVEGDVGDGLSAVADRAQHQAGGNDLGVVGGDGAGVLV